MEELAPEVNSRLLDYTVNETSYRNEIASEVAKESRKLWLF